MASLKPDKHRYRTVAGLIQMQNFLPAFCLRYSFDLFCLSMAVGEESVPQMGAPQGGYTWFYMQTGIICVSLVPNQRTLNIHREVFPGSYGLQQCSHHLGLWPMTLPPTSSESILRSITGCTDF